MNTEKRLKLHLVSGPWGSGTTATIQVLKECGGQVPGPFFQTNDAKTPNCYEMQLFRLTVMQMVDEISLTEKLPREEILERLRYFGKSVLSSGTLDPDLPFILKLPSSAMLLPEICHVFDTKLIICLRSLNAIEQTRVRRQWPSQYGKAVAEILYGRLFTHIINSGTEFKLIRYSDLTSKTAESVRELAQFCELRPTETQIQHASSIISNHQSLSAPDTQTN